MRDHDTCTVGRIKSHDVGIAGPPRGPEDPHLRADSLRLKRRVLVLASLLVIGGLAATSGSTSAGDGFARYLRQQSRDCEHARDYEHARDCEPAR